ncbi:MAG TPA: hypothetical protein VMW27_20695, partial [Thermoanaerobaculia bacterium]|nr:hypothetical protein [Thermoanaerobaculia bacterium]
MPAAVYHCIEQGLGTGRGQLRISSRLDFGQSLFEKEHSLLGLTFIPDIDALLDERTASQMALAHLDIELIKQI